MQEQYADLLNAEEQAFFEEFQALSLEAQRLYVRLISRKGPYFRSDKLSYAEIPQIPQTLWVLEETGFVKLLPEADFELILQLLLRDELLQLPWPSDEVPHRLKKPELLRLLADEGDEEACLTQIRQWFSWLEPLRLKELLIYRLCFFGNLHQDLTEFVLLDLGMIRYETYQIHEADRYFQSRDLLDTTLHLSLLSEFADKCP